jgi:outer membrane lipoprotein-sorting protein
MATSRRRRLGIIGVVAAVVAVLGVANVSANPAPDLPAVGADTLLASTLGALAHPFTISGEVSTHVDIGIPTVPSSIGGGLLGPVALAMGDQHFKVWRSPDGVRVAHLLDLGEQDLIANAHDAWFWDSSSMSAVHLAIPGSAADTFPVPSSPIPSPSDADFLSFAQRVIAAVGPYADVSVEGTAVVAGRPSYELVLTPTSTLTLIGRIAVSVDAQTRLPLQLQVFPRDSDVAAIEGGFTSVSYDPIDPSMFAFAPPPGATVRRAEDIVVAMEQDGTTTSAQSLAGRQQFSFGNGFETRIAIELHTPLPREAAALLPYAGPLLSAIIVERGGRTWLLIGPVPVATLEQDADALP